ncbi:hypothetical protein ES703_81939 [subsurface metagenome]
MSFNWRCPFCNQHCTITDDRFESWSQQFKMGNKYGWQTVQLIVTVCPNRECKEYALSAMLYDGETTNKQPKRFWRLVPRSAAKAFPDYVPQQIRADYEEACLIRDLSPKASATIARRCLQGMIRDFWSVRKPRLVDEIEAIKDRVESTVWQAIDSVRTIGNIGAHMEQDVNLIVDVEANEAGLLLELIEMFVEEWYIAQYERQKKLDKIISVAGEKDKQRKVKDEEEQPQIINGDNV